jgi:L-iditol 2-dehydrogenase
MKALVLEEYRKFAVREEPKPSLQPDEVLVRVRACGICGSDVHGMTGSTGRRIPPIVMGHEAAGELVEIGSGVSGWAQGERVTFDSTVYCGQCWFCQRGEVNLCEDRRVLGVSCKEYRRNGAFAEYVAVPARILYRLPESISFPEAAMVEAVSVAVHALKRTPLGPSDTAVVLGTGMIGLLVVQALKAAGCRHVIAIDRDDERLKLAARLGATRTINTAAEDAVALVKAATSERGADAVFEVIGLGATVQLAINLVRKGGSVTLVGNFEPTVPLPLQAVVTRQITLIGTCASAGEYPECLDLIAAKKIDVTAFISAVSSLEEAAGWFERLEKGEKGLMKVLVQP